jgi:hypothetical protein
VLCWGRRPARRRRRRPRRAALPALRQRADGRRLPGWRYAANAMPLAQPSIRSGSENVRPPPERTRISGRAERCGLLHCIAPAAPSPWAARRPPACRFSASTATGRRTRLDSRLVGSGAFQRSRAHGPGSPSSIWAWPLCRCRGHLSRGAKMAGPRREQPPRPSQRGDRFQGSNDRFRAIASPRIRSRSPAPIATLEACTKTMAQRTPAASADDVRIAPLRRRTTGRLSEQRSAGYWALAKPSETSSAPARVAALR